MFFFNRKKEKYVPATEQFIRENKLSKMKLEKIEEAQLSQVETFFQVASEKEVKSVPVPKVYFSTTLLIPEEVNFSRKEVGRSKFFNFQTKRGVLHCRLPRDFILRKKTSHPRQILQIRCLDPQLFPYLTSVLREIHQSLVGVARGYKKKLKIVGVGYKAFREKNTLRLTLGYSHLNFYELPSVLKTKFGRKNNRLHLSGTSLPQVTEIAASLHALKKPDVYKGKGIRYRGLPLIKKEGKKKK